MPPSILFGTAAFGFPQTEFQTSSDVARAFSVLEHNNVGRIDTGARYPPTNPGQSEMLIGEALASLRAASPKPAHLVIDTKVLAGPGAPDGELTRSSIDISMLASLKRLGVDQVHTLYAHRADPVTDAVEQVEGFNEQINKGRCKEWGVSNHSIPQLKALLEACELKNLTKPSVYQGDYNILTRGVESELLPLLREHGMRYVGFRPVAAGFLTGSLFQGTTEGTRFGDGHPVSGALKKVFSDPDLVDATQSFLDALKKHNIAGVEVALRWVYYHSPLSKEDGVILGASKFKQLEQNLQTLQKGPLPEEILDLVNSLWDQLKSSRGGIL